MAVVRKMIQAGSQPVKDLVKKHGVGRVAQMMGLSNATISDIINSDTCRATFAYLAKRILEDETRDRPRAKKLTLLISIEDKVQKEVFIALAKSMNLKCVLWDLDDFAGGSNG